MFMTRASLMLSVGLLLSNGISVAVFDTEGLQKVNTQPARTIDAIKDGLPSFARTAALTGTGTFLGMVAAYKAMQNRTDKSNGPVCLGATLGSLAGLGAAYYFTPENDNHMWSIVFGSATGGALACKLAHVAKAKMSGNGTTV